MIYPDVKQPLSEYMQEKGGLRAAARHLQCSPSYLSRLMSGQKKNPNAGILRKLGLVREIQYRRVK